jgi:hypothetical protein
MVDANKSKAALCAARVFCQTFSGHKLFQDNFCACRARKFYQIPLLKLASRPPKILGSGRKTQKHKLLRPKLGGFIAAFRGHS